MVKAIKKLANLNVDMTEEERNLLSVAYRNIVGDRRASWTAVASVEQKEQYEANHQNANRIRVYRHKIESELSHICNDLINVIDDHLIPFSSSNESTVFYYKMKGDYNRYLAEFKTGDERKEAVDQSLKAYEAATGMAEVELAPTNPIRLALALNFSVFHYEIMDSRERACYVAKLAYDEAISEVDVKKKDFDKDTTSIMQLLRENLLLWTIFVPEEEGATVRLECRNITAGTESLKAEAVTDKQGLYSIPVDDDFEDDICEIKLVKSPDEDCSEIPTDLISQQAAKITLTTNNGEATPVRNANPLGFMRKVPLPECPEVLKELDMADLQGSN